MYKVYLRDEWFNLSYTGTEFDNLRDACSEARDLQRIMSKERKEAGWVYQVFKGVPDNTGPEYSAAGY